jgi:hypothetical protein
MDRPLKSVSYLERGTSYGNLTCKAVDHLRLRQRHRSDLSSSCSMEAEGSLSTLRTLIAVVVDNHTFQVVVRVSVHYLLQLIEGPPEVRHLLPLGKAHVQPRHRGRLRLLRRAEQVRLRPRPFFLVTTKLLIVEVDDQCEAKLLLAAAVGVDGVDDGEPLSCSIIRF